MERKLNNIAEKEKLFGYIESRQTDKFISLASVSNLNLAELRNKKNQSLMHVAAMVGIEEIAVFLNKNHVLGNFKDVNSFKNRSKRKLQRNLLFLMATTSSLT